MTSLNDQDDQNEAVVGLPLGNPASELMNLNQEGLYGYTIHLYNITDHRQLSILQNDTMHFSTCKG